MEEYFKDQRLASDALEVTDISQLEKSSQIETGNDELNLVAKEMLEYCIISKDE